MKYGRKWGSERDRKRERERESHMGKAFSIFTGGEKAILERGKSAIDLLSTEGLTNGED